MPFPIIALTLGVAGQSAAPYVVAGVGYVGFLTHHYLKENQGLPTFHATADEAVKSARADIDALVTATSEHLHQVELDTMQKNARMDEASANYELNLITMERGAVKLDETVTVVVESQKENIGELERVIEAQVETQASLEAQQTIVQSIAASLENLPELLQLNREKQALRVENARLLFEQESYTTRANMLLDVIKEKDEANERLQAQVDTLESKFSRLASQMESVLAFAQGKQREVDDLLTQMDEQADDKKNAGTHFSLNLFS